MQARQERQRSIWVTTSVIRRAAVFQHVLDEVDAAARAVELVAERHIGGTGGGAETAMHAFAQDLFGFGDMRIGELFGGEVGLHLLSVSAILPGLNIPAGSNFSFTRCREKRHGLGLRFEGGYLGACLGAARISVAWPPPSALM